MRTAQASVREEDASQKEIPGPTRRDSLWYTNRKSNLLFFLYLFMNFSFVFPLKNKSQTHPFHEMVNEAETGDPDLLHGWRARRVKRDGHA